MGTHTTTRQRADALTKLFLAESLGNGVRLNPNEVQQVTYLLRTATVQKVQAVEAALAEEAAEAAEEAVDGEEK